MAMDSESKRIAIKSSYSPAQHLSYSAHEYVCTQSKWHYTLRRDHSRCIAVARDSAGTGRSDAPEDDLLP